MKIARRLDGIGEYYFSQKLREIDELNKQGGRLKVRSRVTGKQTGTVFSLFLPGS